MRTLTIIFTVLTIIAATVCGMAATGFAPIGHGAYLYSLAIMFLLAVSTLITSGIVVVLDRIDSANEKIMGRVGTANKEILDRFRESGDFVMARFETRGDEVEDAVIRMEDAVNRMIMSVAPLTGNDIPTIRRATTNREATAATKSGAMN